MLRRVNVPFASLASLLLLAAACSSDPGEPIVPRAPDPGGPAAPSAEPSSTGSTTPPAPPPGMDAGSDATAPPVKSYDQGPSAGCTKTTLATGLQTRKMTVGGKTRDYLRFIPAGVTAGTPVAVVLGFHGSGGTAAKARGMFDLEAKAGAKAIFIYPQGLPDPAFDGDNRWNPTKGSDDYAFVDQLIAEVETSHCVDRDRIFAVGFSNGARMTSMLGCYRGDEIRAIAPVAPGGNGTTLPLASGACVGEVGVWEGLGDDDADHVEGATLVRDFYRSANGCKATRTATTPAGCEAYDGCRAAVPSVWCTYPGGHAWPPIGAAGVWSFFASFK